MIVIEWTAEDEEEASKIAKALLKRKLIACANIVPSITSHYIWEGRLETSEEVLVFMKTEEELFDDIVEYITDHASYEVPAILALPIERVSKSYKSFVMNAL